MMQLVFARSAWSWKSSWSNPGTGEHSRPLLTNEIRHYRCAGHLLGQRPLQHRLGHLRQQAIGAQQLHALSSRLAQQLIGHLLIEQQPPGQRASIGLSRA